MMDIFGVQVVRVTEGPGCMMCLYVVEQSVPNPLLLCERHEAALRRRIVEYNAEVAVLLKECG